MKIIEYGNILPKETKCVRCNALFEYTPADEKFLTSDVKVVRCPVCGCGKKINASNNEKEIKK